MNTFPEVYARLRRKNYKNYLLLVGCCFFSVLLITAYVCMMRSPTVLSVLPEGGDSRKQVMMIFVMAVLGCAVFTTYASGLFFRSKSQETGIFLALGASKRQVRRLIFADIAAVSLISCVAGAALGMPLAWLLWRLFRLCVVDSQEMLLRFEPQAMFFALAFSIFVIGMLFCMGARFIRRTNIIDIVREAHKSEPIRAVPRWYGKIGILLMIVGGFLGYQLPSFFVLVLHWYAPDGLSAIGYLPLLIGLWMVLLHTVVNGWGKGRNRYKNLIANSMMKFQGRQTVRNMLVITALLAGAYFGMFYAPMLGTGAMMNYAQRPIDYAYHFRDDQDIPLEKEVRQMAEEEGVSITDWVQQPMARLAVDGMKSIEEEGKLGVTWHEEYFEISHSDLFLSETAWNRLTGDKLDLPAGTIASVFDSTGSSSLMSDDISRVTNPLTGEVLYVTPREERLRNDMLFQCRVLDDADYASITKGLTNTWTETMVFFNVENCKDTYPFAKRLFNEIVDRSGPEVALLDAYDEVNHMQQGEDYSFLPENSPAHGLDVMDYKQRDSSSFRLGWMYMPQFRVFDQNDFIRTMAVFMMLFVFIAIVCFAAVIVIAYTRCLTITLVNRQVYDDLRHLGASRAYLRQAVRGQVSRVFFVPALVGTFAIYALYAMIMYFNGEPLGYTAQELAGMAVCLLLLLICSGFLYAVYRRTLHKVCKTLDI